MALYTRAGRARPQRSGFELGVWYLMRLSGLALFVLALGHFSITHFIFDPATQTAQWIIDDRWGSLLWRTVDWLLLTMTVLHSFLGVRTVVQDYVSGGARTALTMLLYVTGIALFLMGTIAVMTLPFPVK
ncbi:MAG TPA: succinate dehydrogenase [Verrucomicrobiae bacterium]|jgi:succinate dehydrogenase / fumarate reductase membrane anchor subunit|nr:succinate dehydrogenase [Verrucomicrobiae bacterium]